MTTLASLLVLAASSASILVGCSCAPDNVAYHAPLSYAPASTLAFREPTTCGTIKPDFASTDTFVLELSGTSNLTVQLTPAVVVGQAVPLNVDGIKASSADGLVQFAFASAGDAAAIDTSAVDSVVVTVVSSPDADGQPLALELRIAFDDGSVLDQTYSSALRTVYRPCDAQLAPF